MDKYNADELLTSEDSTDFMGVGSYGTARRCFHSDMNNVVVKCFPLSETENDGLLREENIQQEAEILHAFNHINIIKVYGVTKWAHSYGIIMEEADGCSLEDLMIHETDKTVPWTLRLRFSSEIANAIDYLHNHDPRKIFVHGDLKPQNILLTKDLVVKVADFGSASLFHAAELVENSLNHSNQCQCTYFYTAPEFLKRTCEKTREMDVYSFAMILYEIITRHEVYKISHFNPALIQKIVLDTEQKPDSSYVENVEKTLSLHSKDYGIFKILQKIMSRGWDSNPKNRPSIAALKSQLLSAEKEFSTEDDRMDFESLKIESNLHRCKRVPLSRYDSSFKMVAERCREGHKLLRRHSFKTTARTVGKFTRSFSKSRLIRSRSRQGTLLALEGVKAWKFDVSSFQLDELPELCYKHSCPSLVKWQDQVFVISGWKTQSVERLDLKDDAAWHEIDPINKNRWFGAATVSSSDVIFVSGGFWDMKSVECYDMRIESPDWVTMSPMLWPRSSHALVFLDGFIYAIGGVGLNSVERCDLEIGVWEPVAPMKHDRNGLAAVVLNQHIYAIGGKSDDGEVGMIEKFNPASGQWSDVTSLIVPRSKHGACVVEGKIFIVGGNTDLVEMYDPLEDLCHAVINVDAFKSVRAVIDV